MPTDHLENGADLWPMRRRRVVLGLSLNEVAAALHMDPAHLELIERQSTAATPSADELRGLAEVLRCSTDNLR